MCESLELLVNSDNHTQSKPPPASSLACVLTNAQVVGMKIGDRLQLPIPSGTIKGSGGSVTFNTGEGGSAKVAGTIIKDLGAHWLVKVEVDKRSLTIITT